MGTDIHGWVEVALDTVGELQWRGVVDATILLGRSYDAFGCLFGVNNYANFTPLAPNRGLPDDLSYAVRQEVSPLIEDIGKQQIDAGSFHSPSWIKWSELKTMDWEEEALLPDSRVHEYKRGTNGELVFDRKTLWSRELSDLTGLSAADALTNPPIWPESQEWEINGRVFRVQKMKRADAFGEDWRAVFKIMEILAVLYSDERVRLVVWFDS